MGGKSMPGQAGRALAGETSLHYRPAGCGRDLILRVWHVDPLACLVRQSPIRVIAVIDDPWVAQSILRHLGAWHAQKREKTAC